MSAITAGGGGEGEHVADAVGEVTKLKPPVAGIGEGDGEDGVVEFEEVSLTLMPPRERPANIPPPSVVAALATGTELGFGAVLLLLPVPGGIIEQREKRESVCE
jgi:hypothetical protein